MIVIIFLDKYFRLGLTNDVAIEIFITPFIFILTCFIFSRKLRENFSSSFVLKNGETYKVICYPVLVAIIHAFLVYIYMYTPYWLGFEAIGIGSKQVTTVNGVSDLGLVIGVSIIGPFIEEFFFRFLLFGGFIMGLTKLSLKYKWINSRKYLIIFSLVIIINSVFSLIHGPNILSFPLYFSGGVIHTLFFIRYGFLAAWISHGMFNFLSPIAHSIINHLFM